MSDAKPNRALLEETIGLIADGTRSHVGRLMKDYDGYLSHMNHWTGRYSRSDQYKAHDIGWLLGRLWLLFVHTGDEEFKDLALKVLRPMIPNLTEGPANDISSGCEIFFGLCVAADILGSDELADLAVKASKAQVAGRWREDLGRFLPWPGFDEKEVPVEWGGMIYHLVWTSHAVPEHLELFARHHESVLAHGLIRPDGSTFHAAVLGEDGAVDHYATIQGYGADSTWARGQSWAIHNFSVAAENAGRPAFDEALQRMTGWWLDHIPADWVPHYDFDDPGGSAIPRDPCAAAMASSALMRAGGRLSHPGHDVAAVIDSTIEELCNNYVSAGGVLLHGSLGDVRKGIYGMASSAAPPGHGDPRAVRARFPQEEIMPYGNYFTAEIIHRRLTGDVSFPSPMAGARFR